MTSFASVVVVNIDDSIIAESFSAFCRHGAIDLIGMKDDPVFTYSVGSAELTKDERENREQLLGKWPRIIEKQGTAIDIAKEIIFDRRNATIVGGSGEKNYTTIVILASEPEKLQEVGRGDWVSLGHDRLSRTRRTIRIGALTCGPNHKEDEVAALLQGPNAPFDAIFLLGHEGHSGQELASSTHYFGLRLVIDLARDTENARDMLRRQRASDRLFWLPPQNLEENSNPDNAIRFLTNSLTSFYSPDDRQKKQQLDEFEDAIARHAAISSEIAASSEAYEDKISQKKNDDVTSSIQTLKDINTLNFITQKAALKQFQEQESAVRTALINTHRLDVPGEITEIKNSSDQIYKHHTIALSHDDIKIPVGNTGSDFEQKIATKKEELKSEETNLKQQAYASRDGNNYVYGPLNAVLTEINESYSSTRGSSKIVKVPFVAGYGVAYKNALNKYHSLPANKLAFWMGALIPVLLFTSLVAHFMLMQLSIGFNPINWLLNWLLSYSLIFAITILAPVIIVTANYLRTRHSINKTNAELTAQREVLFDTYKDVIKRSSTYCYHTKAVSYHREITRLIERKSSNRNKQKNIELELRKFKQNISQWENFGAQFIDATNVELKNLDPDLIGLKTIEVFRLNFVQNGGWELLLTPAPSPNLTSNTKSKNTFAKLNSTLLNTEVAYEIVSLKWQKSKSNAGPQQAEGEA